MYKKRIKITKSQVLQILRGFKGFFFPFSKVEREQADGMTKNTKEKLKKKITF